MTGRGDVVDAVHGPGCAGLSCPACQRFAAPGGAAPATMRTAPTPKGVRTMYDTSFPDDGPVGRPPRADRHAADLELATAVVGRLSADPELAEAEIQVAVQNRVVLLGGYAPNRTTRTHAGDSAWRVVGVFDVCNLIQVPA
ncbi:BON domain-containing protein [Asanoa hainanensis]|uniref:BON domain-containing protein n=1 Tax=Asanoa hainanensis TaxID=560556 RepID=A0A239PFW5_9ACTN|nr:BON domain-containing protein [Asanoa hainanensis]SNT65494.1 BON domain-containing protein [Asanoa hainanensis]